MASRRCSDLAGTDWRLTVTEDPGGHISLTADRIQVVLLWEIRQELQRLNALLHCSSFVEMPRTLKTINRKIPARQARRKKT